MRLCPHGHDKDVVGVNSSHRCKRCAQLDCNKWLRTAKGKIARKRYAQSPKGKLNKHVRDRRHHIRHPEMLRAKSLERYYRNREKRIQQMRDRRKRIKAQYGNETNYFWAMQAKESL